MSNIKDIQSDRCEQSKPAKGIKIKRQKIIAISGSTRRKSTNLQIIKAVSDLLIDKFEVEIYEGLVTLPHFNPDIEDEEGPPLSVANFRLKIEEASGVLICTPEYVFSLPGTLKNALDWTVSTTVFSDKPVAIITASSSGKKAHESLELVMKTLGAKIGQKSKLLIQGVRSKINSEGKISDEATWKEIKELCDSFVETMSMSQ